MAALNELNNGNKYVVFIDPVTSPYADTPPAKDSPLWKMLMCLTSNALSVTVNGVDVTSKCSGNWADSIPTTASWSISADGQAVSLEPGDLATKQSNDEIFDIATNMQSVWAAFMDTTPGSTYYRVGVIFFSSLTETAGTNTAFTFSTTLTGRGELYKAPLVTTP